MNIFELSIEPKQLDSTCGGKAKGLNGLIAAGLNVARGFVAVDINTEEDFNTAADYYISSGLKKVAVRSSASSEDGMDFSNAGQYSTFLNIQGKSSFIEAARACIKSLDNETAASYGNYFSQAKSTKMSIVVQEMVDAKFAGVCFTIDPISKKNDILIEVVKGLGESLVSGTASAEKYTVSKDRAADAGELKRVADNGVLLDEKSLSKVVDDALVALKYFNTELDLEWAIDSKGTLFWLQARPITTLDETQIDELDGVAKDNIVFTNCNIGEMMPGAVTPLTLCTSVHAIDMGLRRMLRKANVYRSMKQVPAGSCVTSFSNHLFFNLTTVYKMATCIAGAKKSSVEASICGKYLTDTPPLPWKNQFVLKRLYKGLKYFRFVFSGNRAMKKLDYLAANLVIPYSQNVCEFFDSIDKNLKYLDEAAWLHYATSSHSGAMSSALLITLMKDGLEHEEAKSLLAGLLEDIDNIESVDILRSMRFLARTVLEINPTASNMSYEELYNFIISNEETKNAYDQFIARHGHRSIKEAEMMSKSWKNDKKSLMENILTVMKTGANEPKKTTSSLNETISQVIDGKKRMAKGGINFLIKSSRKGVHDREYTKSGLVRVIDTFKEAYQTLALELVKIEALPEADLIYFLTHKEIGSLIKEKNAKLIKKASQRRRLFEEQKLLKFNDVYIGKPTAIAVEELSSKNGQVLKGTSISRGKISGKARIVKSENDAKLLEKGEIMIASFTDIGWTPYYSVIGGLVTEVGSALSHGAVVAREYALPLVVNVQNSTLLIKTGDEILLNGTDGTVTIINKQLASA